MKVLMVTSEWPSARHPDRAPFIKRQVNSLRQAGIDVDVFYFRGHGKLLNYLKAWTKLRLLHDIRNYDLIHAQFGQSGLVALTSRVPLIVTFWGSDLHGIVGPSGEYLRSGQVLRILSRFAATYATEIILVSQGLSKYLPQSVRWRVIPQGVDLDLFRPIPLADARSKLSLPQRKYLVLFAANPRNPVKRFSLAQAAIEIVKRQLDVELLTMFGVSHDLVPIYMNASDALVLTSKHEGSPTVVKEALACNLPVVSLQVGDVREQLEHVRGCVLCSDDAPETIARGLIKILRDRSRINGRQAVRDLDERLVATRIIAVYESALAN